MEDFFVRTWDELVGRGTGPMQIRLILQPLFATLLAIRPGLRDAREGRPLYLRSLITDPVNRRARLREGARDVGRIFVIAIVIDFFYQMSVLHRFHPGQALMVAAVLALVPYLIVRSIVHFVALNLQSH